MITRAIFSGLLLLLVSANLAKAAEKTCVKAYWAQKNSPQGIAKDLALENAEALVERVAKSIGLANRPIVISCTSIEKALAYPGEKDSATVPMNQYIIFNPNWLRETVGGHQAQAVTVFGHEMGHFLNQHFTFYADLPKKKKESDADYYAGCAIARLNESWPEAKDLLQRLRADPSDPNNFEYPDVVESIELASKGFLECGGKREALLDSPSSPSSVGFCSIYEESQTVFTETGECRVSRILLPQNKQGSEELADLVIEADESKGERLGEVCKPLACKDISRNGYGCELGREAYTNTDSHKSITALVVRGESQIWMRGYKILSTQIRQNESRKIVKQVSLNSQKILSIRIPSGIELTADCNIDGNELSFNVSHPGEVIEGYFKQISPSHYAHFVDMPYKVTYIPSGTAGRLAMAEADDLPPDNSEGDPNGATGNSLNATREIPPAALELIAEFESFSAAPYDDAVGFCIIGHGHMISKRKCSESNLTAFPASITLDEAREILRKDIKFAAIAVSDLVNVPLNDDQFGALVAFVFNVGKKNFENSKILTDINSRDFEAAARQFERWRTGSGKILPMLASRRACEQALFEGKITPPFSRVQCNSVSAANK